MHRPQCPPLEDDHNVSGESDSLPGAFNDPSFNQALDLADAAIQATAQPDAEDAWAALENAKSEPFAAPPERRAIARHASGDDIVGNAVDRAADRIAPRAARRCAMRPADGIVCRRPARRRSHRPIVWPALGQADSTLVELPPWAIVFAGAVSPADRPQDDTASLLPAAIAFAQQYRGEVLLVELANSAATNRAKANARRLDADSTSGCARRGLSELFGISRRFGLSDVLRGAVDWHDAVEPTAVPRIALLASGEIEVAADSTLRPIAATLIAEWKSAYQLVLIHAPDACDPSLAPLVAASDGTLLLVKLGQTSRDAAEKASSSLYLAGAQASGLRRAGLNRGGCHAHGIAWACFRRPCRRPAVGMAPNAFHGAGELPFARNARACKILRSHRTVPIQDFACPQAPPIAKRWS